MSKLAHPQIYETTTGVLVSGTLIGLVLAWLFFPWMRPALDLTASMWFMMVVAGLSGMCLRASHDTRTLSYGAWSLVMICIAIGYSLHAATLPTELSGLDAALVSLLRLAGIAGVVAATVAGYNDGDDETWRQRQMRNLTIYNHQ